MEQLLFILFILFSVFSALMERRKRKRDREAAEQARQRGQGEVVPEEEDEELAPGWPFPPDPFQMGPRGGEPPVLAPEQDETEQQALALEAEQRAREAKRQAEELERQARVVQPRQRVEDLVKEKLADQRREEAVSRRRRRRRAGWKLDPVRARRAVVYMEILGPPKALRQEEI